MKKIELNKEELTKILKMYNEELLGSQTISEKIGISKPTILRILKENGIIMGPSGRRFIGGREVATKKYFSKPETKERLKKNHKKWSEKNREHLTEYYKQWREKNTNVYRVRIQIWWWLKRKGLEKNLKTEELLGYNFTQFEEKIGTPLLNQQLDHKIPLSWFIDETPVSILFSLENLHYIDEHINKTKSNSYCNKVSNEYKQSILKYIKIKYKNKL
jgi:hypothetical protein